MIRLSRTSFPLIDQMPVLWLAQPHLEVFVILLRYLYVCGSICGSSTYTFSESAYTAYAGALVTCSQI
jgi:hypothetical protein